MRTPRSRSSSVRERASPPPRPLGPARRGKDFFATTTAEPTTNPAVGRQRGMVDPSEARPHGGNFKGFGGENDRLRLEKFDDETTVCDSRHAPSTKSRTLIGQHTSS